MKRVGGLISFSLPTLKLCFADYHSFEDIFLQTDNTGHILVGTQNGTGRRNRNDGAGSAIDDPQAAKS